jgi:hypothetical protein
MEGACIAVAIENYSAAVSLERHDFVEMEANKEHDPAIFTDLEGLHEHMTQWGYYGGRRLLLVRLYVGAACRHLFVHITARGRSQGHMGCQGS